MEIQFIELEDLRKCKDIIGKRIRYLGKISMEDFGPREVAELEKLAKLALALKDDMRKDLDNDLLERLKKRFTISQKT